MSLLTKTSTKNNEIEQTVDDLVLQVVLNGFAALTEKSLNQLILMAERCDCTELADEIRLVLTRLSSTPFTEGEARAVTTNMQSIIRMQMDVKKTHRSELIPEKVSSPLVFEDDPEMLAGFVMESGEHLVSIEEQILILEKDPSLIDTIHAVFRSFHTIKGLAGFLGLNGVQAVAHEVETLLDHARNLRISITPEIVDLVLDSSEYLKDEVAFIRAKIDGSSLPSVRDNTVLLRTLSMTTALASSSSDLQRKSDLIDEFASLAPSPPAETRQTLEAPPVVRRTVRAELINSSIRVETSKLDRLMDMVGEMVIAQSILSNSSRVAVHGDARLSGEMSRLARITGEVQRCAMSMRMMSIGPLFQKNAKMVRDLSRRHGKQVSLELSGEATELDKTIAEELSDPLLHMIRNALDHGIETPKERIAVGKVPVASLRISAEHQAGQIVIAISDDGRGLDPRRLLNKAIERKLIDEGAQLAEEDIFKLIFAPGFSTAEKITDISGRGVGMDVVRQHVETLRGRIEIKSELGKGTTFFIYLPLTLAIIEGLVIVVGLHRYIIPVFSVREMLRPTREMYFTVQGHDEMILIRGELLPLVRLHKRFNVTPRTDDICQGLLVVCEFSGKGFCLFVDDLLGRQEIVIKSLDDTFKCIKGLTGCAILGDGRIGLILDVAGIFHSGNERTETAAA